MGPEATAVRSIKINFRDGEERYRWQARQMWNTAINLVLYKYPSQPEEELTDLLKVMACPYRHLPRELVGEEIQRDLKRTKEDMERHKEQGLKPNLKYLADLRRTARLLQKAGVLGEERRT